MSTVSHRKFLKPLIENVNSKCTYNTNEPKYTKMLHAVCKINEKEIYWRNSWQIRKIDKICRSILISTC